MDKIFLQNCFYRGHIGVSKSERAKTQAILIDLEISLDLKKAGKSDHLDDTVNYCEVKKRVGELVEKKEQILVEALAAAVAKLILTQYPRVCQVLVRVKKPQAALRNGVQMVGVEITRRNLYK